MEKHIEEFKRDGYTVFNGLFDLEQVEQWKTAFENLLKHQPPLTDKKRAPEFGDVVVLDNLIEKDPVEMMPAITNSVVLDFLEAVMGPFVQMESLRINRTSPATKSSQEVSAINWHRDGWALNVGTTDDYLSPQACNVLTYLQDLTEDSGPLRVIPGSHRGRLFVSQEDAHAALPENRLIKIKAGDTVIIHSSILHSGSPNTSDQPRYFMSRFYTKCYLPRRDNHDGPNVQRILAEARERNDRRMMRLFGEDELAGRRCMQTGGQAEEVLWKRWIEEDRAVLIPRLPKGGENQ